jgi:hypothetical protein
MSSGASMSNDELVSSLRHYIYFIRKFCIGLERLQPLSMKTDISPETVNYLTAFQITDAIICPLSTYPLIIGSQLCRSLVMAMISFS